MDPERGLALIPAYVSARKNRRFLPVYINSRMVRIWPKKAKVAEREGFEPSVPVKARRISSAVQSTTLPPLRRRRLWQVGETRNPSVEGGPLAARFSGGKRRCACAARKDD
ncbi:hypothetical protein WR25_20077 [Diploscapter pachys]|uniref:Uncharacterized protein n=1 Tax=Diploscapter pachys TaxID=2018661 RepID=A0A2A2JWG5_9BILA|nr:hypothetical protein WR25_20077 [Diploscapter pachys]